MRVLTDNSIRGDKEVPGYKWEISKQEKECKSCSRHCGKSWKPIISGYLKQKKS